MRQIGVGIIGCGNISGIYLQNLTKMFNNVKIVGVCDLDETKAKAAAEKYQVKIFSMEQMLWEKEIEIVVNLTTPASHFDICKKILQAGKNAYVEKPVSLRVEEGKELVTLAEQEGLLLGGAPDTFLGAGIQTAIKVIKDGIIGDIVGASAFMMCHGHESWHPAPEFYYKPGGGPMFDMGPYYLTAMVSMMGPVEQVYGMTTKGMDERIITSEPQYGKKITVEAPTHVAGLMRFQSGAVGNIITSFDVWGSQLPRIEVYGTRGSMMVPDPNTFGGEIWVKQQFDADFEKFPLLFDHSENSRGFGIHDMANCILEGRTNLKASGKMALHVLEIMHAFHTSSDSGTIVPIKTEFKMPETRPLL